MKRISALIFVIFYVSLTTNGQSLRISIKKGNSISFYFNSLEKYTNGIEYTDFTIIAVAFSEYDNTPVPDSTWQIQIKALTVLEGSGTNTIALDRLRVFTSNGGSTTPTFSSAIPGNTAGWFELTGVFQDIVRDGPEGDFTQNLVNISWDCGVANSVMSQNADYYTVDIEILVDIE